VGARGPTDTRHAAAWVGWLVRLPVTPGAARNGLLTAGAAFIVWGVISGQRAHVGYETPGTPLYRPEAKVNRDTAEIRKFFPIDEGWIVLKTPDYPDPHFHAGGGDYGSRPLLLPFTSVTRVQIPLGTPRKSRTEHDVPWSSRPTWASLYRSSETCPVPNTVRFGSCIAARSTAGEWQS
jgi:hypothetical protein